MKVSIFTPTNNIRYLSGVYDSIKDQSYDEWVIYPNNGCGIYDIPEIIKSDSRTRLIVGDHISTNVGAVKNFCCSYCSGDILVELDHDDILLPTAIDKIRKAFEDNSVVFVYSDCAEFNDSDGSNRYYHPDNGWEHYTITAFDREYLPAITPDHIPYHSSIIHFAPNHVRSFLKSAYINCGGYDPTLSICDDQDLMCRLYLEGDFYHIPECLYLYRVHGENTWLRRNADIQVKTVELQKKYIRPMIDSWINRHGLIKIDLGGRFNSPEGYLSVDQKDGDVQCDLNGRWPFEDSSVGMIRAFDIIEHLKDPIHTMSEIHRVLVPGGYACIEVPSTDGRGAFQDPTHCCYSKDTEILTSDGFKLFSQLDGTEDVYAYDKDQEIACLQPITKVHEFDYSGQMVHFSGRALDCLVTPNHNMVVGSSDNKTPFRFMMAEDILKRKAAMRIPSSCTFDGNYPEYFAIPNSQLTLHRNPKKGFVNDTVLLPIKPFMAFMGWYISEGWTTIKDTEKDGGKFNFFRIGISQSEKANPEVYNRIGECIKEMGYSPFKDAMGWYFNDKAFALWLSQLGHSHEKYIPLLLKQMAPELLEIMLETLMLGDGSYQGSFGTYATISSRLASDIQEIAIKCNYRSTLGVEKRIGKQVFVNPDYRAKYDMNLVYISKTKDRYITNRSLVDYQGKVYCVTIPEFNVILTRRNGKVIWAGNSYWNENSFWYYTDRNLAQYIDNTTIRFKKIVLDTYYPTEWHENNNISYVRADLVCIKDGIKLMGLDLI